VLPLDINSTIMHIQYDYLHTEELTRLSNASPSEYKQSRDNLAAVSLEAFDIIKAPIHYLLQLKRLKYYRDI
jgi:hypothetical protein